MEPKSNKVKMKKRFGPGHVSVCALITLSAGLAAFFALRWDGLVLSKIVVIFFIAVLLSNTLALYIYKVLKKSRYN